MSHELGSADVIAPQLDLFCSPPSPAIHAGVGLRMKERGQKRAIEKAGESWRERAIALLARFIERRQGEPFKFEDFRKYAVGRIAAPPSHNAWGALPRIAVSRGMIEFTGRFENAESPATRSHPVRVWIRKGVSGG